MNLAPEILQHVQTLGMLLTVKEASRLLRVSRNRFIYYFVETGVIKPIYLKGQKHPRFSLFDVLEIPNRLKEFQEAQKQAARLYTNGKSITDLAFEAASREIQ